MLLSQKLILLKILLHEFPMRFIQFAGIESRDPGVVALACSYAVYFLTPSESLNVSTSFTSM